MSYHLVVFPIALISFCCVMFTANDSEVVDCGLDVTLLLSSLSFRVDVNALVPANGNLQPVTIYNSLLTTACPSVGIFAIVHSLLDRVDGCARHRRFETSLTLCRARRSAELFTRLSLCRAILQYTTLTNFFFNVTVTEHRVD